MHGRWVAVFAVAVLGFGCSNSSSGGAAADGPSGTVLGSAFSPLESVAVPAAPADCGGTFVSKLILSFGGATGACAAATNACLDRQSATGVAVTIERLGADAQPAIGPGTYALGASSDATGQLFVVAYAGRTDAGCGTVGMASASSGTVQIEASAAQHVTGTLNLSFPDGGTFGGRFDALVCTEPYDTCNGDACTGPRTCVP